MSLIQEIKARQLSARKAREGMVASALTTLIGEAEVVGKNNNRDVTDAEVVAMLKKFIKNATETRKTADQYKNHVAVEQLDSELALYHKFLPTQMDEDGLRAVLAAIIQENVIQSKKQLGVLLKTLKEQHNGLYDGAVASRIAAELLSKFN
jgi:uncharacterized protein YqeY